MSGSLPEELQTQCSMFPAVFLCTAAILTPLQSPAWISAHCMGAPGHLQLNAKDKQHFKLFLCCLYWRIVIKRGNEPESIPEIQQPWQKMVQQLQGKHPLASPPLFGDSCSTTNPSKPTWKLWRDTAGKVNPSRCEISAPPSRGANQRLWDVNAKQSF